MHEPSTLLQVGGKVADQLQRYTFRTWGFGEEIGLRGLLAFDDIEGTGRYRAWVQDLVSSWARKTGSLTNADHVAPGCVILELYRASGRQDFLEAAVVLGALYRRFPRVHGVPVHRQDLPDWSTTIWVDCLPIDAPFLFRLASVTGDATWAELAIEHLRTYVEALWDPGARLFVHGFDTARQTRSPVHWARGNGWALLGLVDVWEALPHGDENAAFAREHARALVDALVGLQAESGAWHTVLDDVTAPLEGSTSALFAFTLMRARRSRLLDPDERIDRCIERAMRDLGGRITADGALLVSSATPVGERFTYVDRDQGVFPWGQGPALLAITEHLRAGAAAFQEEMP